MNRSFLRPGISFVLAAVLLLSATACAAHEPVLPPSRWGEMQIRSMFERYYSISDAFQAADAVARVTVGDWQGEDLHNWVTFFDAAVQESYKGDLPRHFTLVQGGCSEASSPNYPLFINGTELLVFLKDYDGSGEKYHPITDYNTMLYAVYDENGHRYFLDSFGTMRAQDTLTPGQTTLTAQELTQLTARIAQTDPVLSNAVVQANQNQEAVIYRQSDLEELFKSLS